jgi:hypothetical protein
MLSEYRKTYLLAHNDDIRKMVWNGFNDVEEWENHKEKLRNEAMKEQTVKYLASLVHLQSVSNKLNYLKLIVDAINDAKK